MRHPNVLHIANQDLFEISIGDNSSAKKMKSHVRRVGLASSLGNFPDQKRPGEYYLLKLSQSSVNLTAKSARRPLSGSSLVSDNSKDSDDVLLVVLSHFDCPDSRLSSMTNYSTYSNKLVTSSPKAFVLGSASDLDCVNSSISTLTLQPESSDVSAGLFRPQLKGASTTNILDMKPKAPLLARNRTVSSSFLLGRTKSKFFTSKETKERQQLRKKLYDDNEDDDEILTNDLDLVFNVPVILNQGEIHRYRKNSSSSSLSRHDLTLDDDKYGSLNPPVSMRPFPLPGKLNNTINPDSTLPSMPEDSTLDTNNLSAISDSSVSFAQDEDTEISNNISHFYNQRSLSYTKFIKVSREQQMVYKLPSYVRSQTSIEDLTLMSPEKLEVVDQSRPINLPPKSTDDKIRHNKELHVALAGYESTLKSQNDARRQLAELFMANLQLWEELLAASGTKKDLIKQLNRDKEKYRKLNWETTIDQLHRYEYFMKILTHNLGEEYPSRARDKLRYLEAKFQSLSEKMRATKDAEFEKVTNLVLKRPLYFNFLIELAEMENNDFDVDDFKRNFKHMLYIKSLSDGGLKPHHEIFVIPMFLILFQLSESVTDICILIEMFDACIFTPEFFNDLNESLSSWKKLSLMSSLSARYKILKKFKDLKEFENLSSNHFFEIILQFNDRLPLSLSAPSTPCIPQGARLPLSSAKQSLDDSCESPQSVDVVDPTVTSVISKSSSLGLMGIFLQLLVTYSLSPRGKKRNFLNLFQSFLLTIFQFYHINWNTSSELVKGNKSIKLNKCSDQLTNLESFVDKWKDVFKKM